MNHFQVKVKMDMLEANWLMRQHTHLFNNIQYILAIKHHIFIHVFRLNNFLPMTLTRVEFLYICFLYFLISKCFL